MDVHVISNNNIHLYSDEIDQFFRERHKIYVEELHWRDPAPDGREIDQFDTDAAVYLLGIEDGRVITGSRFLPTSEPHMLSEVFPHLCTLNEGIIRDPTVAEWTRGFIVADRREGLGVRLKAAFCYAVMEYCLQQGITRIGGIQEIYWLSLWKRFGWRVEVNGVPEMFGDVAWVPAYFDVTQEAMAGAKRWARLDRSILVQKGPAHVFIPRGETFWAGSTEINFIPDAERTN